jgi:hypothetical protein
MPMIAKENSSKKNSMNFDQINFVLNQLDKFKEEGSTTKWFSEKHALTKELALLKHASFF